MSRDVASALGPRYTLLEELGRGGMATVYRARTAATGDDVAIKVLDPAVASTLDPARFSREIRLAQRLDHPNILPVLESGEADGYLYFVMPLVEGESLRERIAREGTISLAETRRIVRAIAAGLEHAHGAGIVHRDIKPENILLSDEDTFVVDFGIARLLSPIEDDRLTETGQTVGTPAYLSPEQAGGDADPDARSDVYSLACVVHEMLTGEPPFSGTTGRAVIARHISAPPPRLDVVRPDLPAAVADTLERALAKFPADRFATVAQFAAALDVDGSSRRRRGRTPALLGAVAAFVVAFAGWWLWMGDETRMLDAERIVVFPFPVTDAGAPPTLGWEVALAIGAALEHTEPLRFHDGYRFLSDEVRRSPDRLSPHDATAIARALGARYYIDGVVHGDAGDRRVTIRLHDAGADSLVAQDTGRGAPGARAPDVALAAILPVLGRILDPGRTVDLAALTDRAPAANVSWLQGERSYRQSRFAEALDFYKRAVAADSLHAFAAVKGARTAHWESRFTEAEDLVRLADRNRHLLPTRYRHYLDGLKGFLGGETEPAIGALEQALASAPDWPEATAALGEIYYHLLPGDAVRPDSTARALFRASVQDSTFTPPLSHLTELALREGDLAEARELFMRWRATDPDSVGLRQLDLSLQCAEEEWTVEDWRPHVDRSGRAVWQAAVSLGVMSPLAGCALGAFEALLDSDQIRSVRWSALTHLFGNAMARGEYAKADSMVGVGVESGIGAAYQLYVYGLLGGGPFASEVGELMVGLGWEREPLLSQRSLEWRWMLGVWLAHQGDDARLSELVADLRSADSAEPRHLRARLSADLEARLLVLRGRPDSAIAVLRAVEPVADRGSVVALPHYSLGPERLLLAEVLLLSGAPEDAARTAALLDHRAPSIYPTLAVRSLQIRLEAARLLGQDAQAAALAERLASLGRAPRALSAPSP